MSFDPGTADKNHWLAVHRRLRVQVRALVLLLASLTLFAVFQFFNRLQWLNDHYDFVREFTLELQEQGARPEVAATFGAICEDPDDDCADGSVLVDLFTIREIGWEAERYLHKHHPRRAQMSFQGVEVDSAMFALATVLLPVIIMAIIYSKLRGMRRIADLLRSESTRGGELQQTLNSIFYERVTMELGEGAIRHALAGSLLLVAIGFSCVLFSPLSMHMVINSDVEITYDGHVMPLPDVALNDRTSPRETGPEDNAIWLDILSILAVLVLGAMIFAVSFQQIRQRREPTPGGDPGA